MNEVEYINRNLGLSLSIGPCFQPSFFPPRRNERETCSLSRWHIYACTKRRVAVV